jgi:hypothetical protein
VPGLPEQTVETGLPGREERGAESVQPCARGAAHDKRALGPPFRDGQLSKARQRVRNPPAILELCGSREALLVQRARQRIVALILGHFRQTGERKFGAAVVTYLTPEGEALLVQRPRRATRPRPNSADAIPLRSPRRCWFASPSSWSARAAEWSAWYHANMPAVNRAFPRPAVCRAERGRASSAASQRRPSLI